MNKRRSDRVGKELTLGARAKCIAGSSPASCICKKSCGCDQVGKELGLRSGAKCLAGSSPAIRTKKTTGMAEW